MNVISLFTGVGGFDLGLERAGHRIVGQCEADANARKVLRRHWPDVPIHEDVNTYEPTESADLVAGGFPCQDLSVAGKRAGLAGERSGLFFEAARISDVVLGDGGWVLVENVPGLLSSNGGADFGIVLATLADLGFHDLAWRVLDSRFFGVPQRRRRVFILARRARGRRASEVLLEPEGGGGNHQAGRETGKVPSGSPGPSVAGTLGSISGGFRTTDLDGQGAFVTAPTLSTKYGESAGQDLGQPGALVTDGGFREPTGRGPGDTLRPTTDDRGREAGSGLPDDQGRADGPTPDPDGVRTTPGVPGRVDDPVTCAYDPKPDGPRYAQMGNAVTVNVAEWIGHRLREFG